MGNFQQKCKVTKLSSCLNIVLNFEISKNHAALSSLSLHLFICSSLWWHTERCEWHNNFSKLSRFLPRQHDLWVVYQRTNRSLHITELWRFPSGVQFKLFSQRLPWDPRLQLNRFNFSPDIALYMKRIHCSASVSQYVITLRGRQNSRYLSSQFHSWLHTSVVMSCCIVSCVVNTFLFMAFLARSCQITCWMIQIPGTYSQE